MNKFFTAMRTVCLSLSLVAALTLFIGYALPASAQQQKTVSGTVVDPDGNPLAGATVSVVNTSKGVITDINGKYSITAKSSESLEFSFLGYTTVNQLVGNRTTIDVQLKADASTAIDDVVVIGYGTVAKKDLTGSVATVKMGDVKDAPVTSIDNALQGRIAGADFLSTTGEPGATTSIRIRGTRSINASNEPLIVVDGIMDAIHDLNDINAEDIASISVLKDASSTAIYGSRGANGVILITTKQGAGRQDKVNITFKTDIGFSQLPRMLDIMSASEFAQYRNDYAYFGGDPNHTDVGANSPLSEGVYKDPFSYGEGTNWVKEITRTAMYQNYALSLSSHNKKSSYYASFSYNDTQGIIQESGQQRFTGRINLDTKLFKWLKIGYKGSYTWRHNDVNKTSIGGTAYYSAAQYLSPLIKPNDNYNPLHNGGQRINTPRALVDLNTYYHERHSSNHSFVADIEPIKDLHIKSVFSYYMYQRHTYRYYPGNLPKKTEVEGGEAYRYESDEASFSSETTAAYKWKTKSGHAIDVLGGFSAYQFATHAFSLSGSGYMDDAVMWNNMNAVLDKETYSASTSYSKKTKMSGYARVNWNYKSRYYLTATGRYDGASNFAANNKWAFFPSAAAKWNVAAENWMKDVKWIDDLSIRLSAGLTGNDAISAYQSLANMSSTTGGYLFDGSQPVAFYRSRLDSPDLTWEKTASYNLALDWSMFKGRLNITAEAYKSQTTDLLMSLAVANQTGYSSRLTNIGSTSNKGLELSIESQNIVRPNFQWSTAFTISHNTQRVEDIGSEEFISAYNSPGNSPFMMYGYVKGYPLNSLWGFKYAGVWKNADEGKKNDITKTYISKSGSTSNGYPRYYDLDHNGILDKEDLIYQGNADPVIYGGLQNTFYIYGLKLSFYFNYSLGGKIYNYSEFYMGGSTFSNQYRYMLNSWHPVRNPESEFPRAGSLDAAMPSDFMIHDASYIRLKNITLSYTFDLRKKTKNLRDITISASGENLYLWKNYNGFDPDVSSEGESSTLRRMDLGAYPKPRTIIFGVQIRY